jgi:hypothetical protein
MPLLQVTLGAGATQVTALSFSASTVVFQNNAAAVCRVGDSTVSATKGIQLTAAGAAGSTLTISSPDRANIQLSKYFLFGTATQAIDILFEQ